MKLAGSAALALLALSACGPRSAFVPMGGVDPKTGLEVFYAPPDSGEWRQAGRIRIQDARTEGQAESLALKEGARNGCDAVYIAGIDESHEVSGFTVVQQLLSIGGDADDRRRVEKQRDRDLQEPHYSTRAVCLIRRPPPSQPAVATVGPLGAPAPIAAAAVAVPVPPPAPETAAPPTPVQRALGEHQGRQVTLRLRDGSLLQGKLAGYDGGTVYLASGSELRRFSEGQVEEVQAAAP